MNGEPDNKTYNTFIELRPLAPMTSRRPTAKPGTNAGGRCAAMFAAMGPFPDKDVRCNRRTWGY